MCMTVRLFQVLAVVVCDAVVRADVNTLDCCGLIPPENILHLPECFHGHVFGHKEAYQRPNVLGGSVGQLCLGGV